MLDIEELAKRCETGKLRSTVAKINKAFREADESHLWPINGRFNATERAIAKTGEHYYTSGLEYAQILDSLISHTVNKEV